MKKILLTIVLLVITLHANPKEPILKDWKHIYNNKVITTDDLWEYWDTVKIVGSEKEYWYFSRFENNIKCQQFLSVDKKIFTQKCEKLSRSK